MTCGLRSGVALFLAADGESLALIEIYSQVRRGPDPALSALFATASRVLVANILLERARHAAAESAKRYAALFQSSRDALMTLAPPSWRFTSANRAAIAIFGARDEEDFVSRAPWEYSPELQQDGRRSDVASREMIDIAMREGTNFFSWTHRRLDGQPIPASVLLSRVDVDGACFLQATVRDESRIQRVLAAEAAARTMLDAVMDSAPALILVVDAAGRIQFINKVLPSYRREDVLGSYWLQYVIPEEHARHEDMLRRVLDTGASETYETISPAPDGRRLWFSSHISPLRTGNHIASAVIVAQDVTEVKRTQVEFAASQRLAAVGALAAGVAHEINTPIQFVGDSIHFLRDAAAAVFELVERMREACRLAAEGAPGPELRDALAAVAEAEEEADLDYTLENVPEAFERCVDGLERVSTIVRSMKEFAHPARREMAPVDLNRTIENTLTIARNEYKYVAEIETDFGDLPPVTCHVNDINQVVLNLVVNAAHAIRDVVGNSGNKGILAVRTRQDGGDVVISIRDTGPGIPESIRQRIFDQFFTTKEVGNGTGQGLALAWSIVKEKHGGALTFETRMGEGTTFLIRLPIAGATRRDSSEWEI
ncbi:MAG: PAS domain S-box protein [Candidatus Schekmanbacteria bacterium]|nr:PAS domain S-box protein [Candidatus Schekmanbacteria bacterium]